MAGAIIYRQVATILNGETSAVITLDHSFADTNYSIHVELPYQTSWWVTDKTVNGFTLHVGTAPSPYDSSIPFSAFHE